MKGKGLKNFITRSFICAGLTMISSLASAALSLKEIKESYGQSYQYEKLQNYQDAIQALTIVAINYPLTYTVNLRLGHLFLLQKKLTIALNHFSLAEKAAPDAVSPRIGQMSVYIEMKKFDKSDAIGFKVLQNDFYNYYVNLRLAYSLILQGKHEPAQKIIHKMQLKYPEDTLFMAQSAQVHALKKSYSVATEIYQNILILDPDNIEAKIYLSNSSPAKK